MNETLAYWRVEMAIKGDFKPMALDWIMFVNIKLRFEEGIE
jgi:hypothetical protein